MFILLDWRRFSKKLDMKVIRLAILVGIILFFPVSSMGLGFSGSLPREEKIAEFYHTDTVVLVTGFEPFGGFDVNPAQVIAETLDGQVVNGATIIGISVPVNFTESVEVVTQAIEDFGPSIVVSIGLAAGSRMICIEKVGLNLRKKSYEDGRWFNFRRLNHSGPWIRLSSLPTCCIAKEIRRAGIPARQSFFAGIYICNALLYGVLGFICENDLQIKAGFIHVPLLSSQDPKGMELETMVEATKIAIQVCL